MATATVDQRAIVDSVFQELSQNAQLATALSSSPASVFIQRGFVLPEGADEAAFNAFCLSEEVGLLPFLQSVDSSHTALSSSHWKCLVCKIGFYTLAILIAAAITIGVGLLTQGAAVVVAVADALGVAAATGLAFIQGLAAAGITATGMICVEICKWIGACS